MSRSGLRPSSAPQRRASRWGSRLVLEGLEARRLLSTASDTIVATPAWGWNPGSSGGGSSTGAQPGVTNPTPYSSAITPTELAKAYGFTASASTGTGKTIAIVDAYNDPNIKADLATFDAYYGLPAANLTVMSQTGSTTSLPSTDSGWSLEIALDVEYAHAAAPGANIILVEARSASVSDLMAAVQTAAKNANVVSMSFGSSEFSSETSYDTAAYFANPSVTFVASAGDDGGASGTEWPAASPYVVSVGGTTLTLADKTGTYGSETSWSGSGSRRAGYSGSGGGVSTVESVPGYQATALGTTYRKRATPDIASDANPSSGVSVYDSLSDGGQSGWFQVGGTSAGAPVWAGLVAAADQARATNGLSTLSSTQTLTLLYSLYGTSTTHASTYAADFHDVTSGSNYAGAAGSGYDLVTGLGSPVASKIIAAAATSTSGKGSTLAIVAGSPGASTTGTVTTHAIATVSATTSTATTSSPTIELATAPTTTLAVAPAAISHVATAAPASLAIESRPSQASSPATFAALRPIAEPDGTILEFNPDAETEALPSEAPVEVSEASAIVPASPSDAMTWDVALSAVVEEAHPMIVADLPIADAAPIFDFDMGEDESSSFAIPGLIAGAAFAAAWGIKAYRSRTVEEDGARRPALAFIVPAMI